jgi:hypothetical protein
VQVDPPVPLDPLGGLPDQAGGHRLKDPSAAGQGVEVLRGRLHRDQLGEVVDHGVDKPSKSS